MKILQFMRQGGNYQLLPKWDGVSRICTMFRDMLGTDSRLDPDLDYNYQKEVAECWMVGAIAKQYQRLNTR